MIPIVFILMHEKFQNIVRGRFFSHSLHNFAYCPTQILVYTGKICWLVYKIHCKQDVV
jgi:hypothetical protein